MKKPRSFKNIAKLMKTSRHNLKLSQEDLSKQLGYKNGQFVSNIERGLCSIPIKKMKETCEVLNITPRFMAEIVSYDYKDSVLENIESIQ